MQSAPWDQANENLLQQWALKCAERSRAHEDRANVFRAIRLLDLPFVVAALVMACLTIAMNVHLVDLGAAFLVIGIGQGLLFVLDASGRVERHLNYAGRYMDLASDVSQMLLQPVRCRPPADVFAAKVKISMQMLNRNAPWLMFGPLGGRFELPKQSASSPLAVGEGA